MNSIAAQSYFGGTKGPASANNTKGVHSGEAEAGNAADSGKYSLLGLFGARREKHVLRENSGAPPRGLQLHDNWSGLGTSILIAAPINKPVHCQSVIMLCKGRAKSN